MALLVIEVSKRFDKNGSKIMGRRRNINLQLVAVRGINVAGHLHGGRARGRVDVEGDRGVVWGPVDKVDQVDAEVLGVGIDRGPLQIKGGTAGQGRVDGRVGELDGRRQRRSESEQRQEMHHDGGQNY